MGIRSRLGDTLVRVGKTFGTSVPASFTQGEAASQMTPASPFSPGTPIGPYDGYDRVPRSFNFTTGYNISARPRLHEAVSFSTLTGLVESYDVAQIVIWHRIDSIRSLDWKLVAADHYFGDVTDAIPLGLAALRKPDRKNYFKTWLAKYLYDILAWDAGTLYRQRNRAGRCIGLAPVDGRSIAPLLDYWGNSPDEPAEAYVQYVNGLPWNWLTRADLIYEPFRPVSGSPYGRPPIESVILNANTDIRFQVYFLQRFTQGNLPAAFAASPDSWSPDQIEQFQTYWDAMMLGDQAGKHQVKWMPPGSKFEWSDEKDFSDVFSLFMMRKTAAAYHVVPSDLGFTESVNRSSGESQADVQHRVGDLPLMEHVEEIISMWLQDDLGLPLKHEFDRGEEQVDQQAQAQADKDYMDRAVVSASEIREMRYGLTDSTPVPRVFFSERAGPIPLNSLLGVAGPVDAQTAAPEPGAKLPHQAFTVVEGVVTSPPLIGEPLAEQEYGPAALPPGSEPVAKESEGAPAAGITSETGVYSYDLEGRSDEEEPDEAAQVAKEMSAFRRFEKARRRSGEWRDFEFRAADPVTAHNLNDGGRLAVRKAAGEVAVAGLAVLAADTGRVLMLQRALCDGDPAAGTWEFPGGHVEEGETPFAAAAREWSEETGALLPFSEQAMTDLAFGHGAGWTSGIYAGFVYLVPSEDCVPVRSGSQVTNPDDPDGDQSEAIAWWDPADLPGNPAIRPELAADLDAVMAALGCTPAPDCCGAGCCSGGCCDGTGGCGCGLAAADEGAVAKAGGAGPKAPMLDTRNLTGVWAEVYGRRNKLLAKHQRAVAAAWDACIAELGSPASVARSFRSEAVPVAKLAGPNAKRWKEAGTAAALAWLQGIYRTKGYAALVAAIEQAIAEGMAEGEADALALAADKAGKTGFAIGKAFTAALAALQGDPDISRLAQDAADGMAEGAAGDAGGALADQAGHDGSDKDMTAALVAALSGGKSQAVQVGTDWALYAAILAGALALYQRVMAQQPAEGTPAGTGPEQPPAPPVPAQILLDWITAGDDRVCATCQDYADNGPYAPEDVPGYPHPRCRCSVDISAGSGSSSFLGALLDSLSN